MSAVDVLRGRASRIYHLMQRTRNERRRARLRDLYQRCYETYQKQKLIDEDLENNATAEPSRSLVSSFSPRWTFTK